MDRIKAFLDQKKRDRHFKNAGPGRTLGAAAPAKAPPQTSLAPKGAPRERSAAEREAAAAALARLDGKGKKPASVTPRAFSSGAREQKVAAAEARRAETDAALAAERRLMAAAAGQRKADPQALAMRRLQMEARAEMGASAPSSSASPTSPNPGQAASAARPPAEVVVPPKHPLHFLCPLCAARDTKSEIRGHIVQCLQQQAQGELDGEGGVAAAAELLATATPSREARQTCIETIGKYLRNVAAHPTETKYHRIRLNNKVFKERVVSCIGGLEALRAAGFALETEGEGEGAEQVLRLPESRAQALAAEVEAVMAALESAEPVVGQLDRAVRLFRPSAAGVNPARIEIPTDFYTITSDDIRTLHSQLQTEREREQTLRTQAMRDAERSKRIYHYTLLRIRFPDGIILQGTFRARETIGDLALFVQENLSEEAAAATFTLVTQPNRTRLEDPMQTLRDAQLVPSALIHLHVEGVAPEAVLSPDTLASTPLEDLSS